MSTITKEIYKSDNHTSQPTLPDPAYVKTAGMATYNKTLDPADYVQLGRGGRLYDALKHSVPCNIDHPHRRWEYSLTLAALLEVGCQEVLEIGSGGSLFAPMATQAGLQVTVVDPAERVIWAQAQGEALKKAIGWYQQDFMTFEGGPYDGVACLSVLEHVQADVAFFRRALSLARRIAVFTVDFSVDGGVYSADHLRTYTAERLKTLGQLATPWHLLGEPDWQVRGPHVFAYNFASLVLVREDA